MQLKNIELPFSQEWYDETIGALSPMDTQTAFDRINLLPEPQRSDLLTTLAMGLHLATPEKRGTATISRTRNGQYKVKFKGDNHKNLSPQDTLHNEADLRKTLAKYFSTFEVIEK